MAAARGVVTAASYAALLDCYALTAVWINTGKFSSGVPLPVEFDRDLSDMAAGSH